MALNTRVEHYGFALAMPATLLLVACFVHFLPAAASRAGGRDGAVTRALAAAAVCAFVSFHLHWSSLWYARKTLAVGSGGDVLRVEPIEVDARAATIWTAITKLREEMGPTDTLLALPEGLSLNYWLRRRDPSRYGLFLPPELAAFGGDGPILADLAAHRPDYVALVDRESAEFGVGPFGVDPRNGRGIVDWVDRRYRPILKIGGEPFHGSEFGVVILERADRHR